MLRLDGIAKLLLVIACLTYVGTATATDLYSVQYAGTTPLFTVDQTTGALTTINPSASADIGDLTSDTRPGHNTIWGVVLNTPASDALQTFDPLTGGVTSTIPITGLNGDTSQITSIAFDPVGGVLYGNTTPAFGDPSGDNLYKIDPVSGVASFIAQIRAVTGAPFTDIFALGFDQKGTLFGVSNTTSELLSINTGTAVGSSIATLSTSSNFDIASRPEDDVMFLTTSFNNTVYTVDTATGLLTVVGSHTPNLVGLAFANAVPEPETWALIGLGFGLIALSARRRPRG